MSALPAGVKAVFFDAVGTLLHPDPPAGDAYSAVGARFGSRLGAEVVRARFRTAFQRQERIDTVEGWRTDEEREARRWRAIVAEVLDDVSDGEGCFRALYDHFASPCAWRVDPQARAVLAALAGRGLRVGLASNFDRRLRAVAEGLPDLAGVELLVISSEVGHRKPAAEFFAALVRAIDLAPEEVVLVGDDPVNDHAGGRTAGLHVRLLDPSGRSALPDGERLSSLECLLADG